jgi:prophage tail gpP-like protein
MIDLKIISNGRTFKGWTSLSLKRAIDALAMSFTMDATDRWSWDEEPYQLFDGDPVEIFVDDELVLTGYIDEDSSSISASSRSISFSGRCKTGDLIDSSISPGKVQFKNQSFLEVAREVCEPFGITISADFELPKVDTITIKTGQTVHEFLNEMAKKYKVLFHSTALGNLRMTTIARAKSETHLIFGENIKDVSVSFSSKGRYSEYVCLGIGDGKQLEGKSRDSEIARYRPKVFQSEDSVKDLDVIQKRADWERAYAISQALTVTCTVVGWRQYTDGPMWDRNLLVRTKVPYRKINEDLLVKSVSHKFSNSGTITAFELVRKDSYA